MPEQPIPDELIKRYFSTVLQFQRMLLTEHKRPPGGYSQSTCASNHAGMHDLKHSERMMLFAIQYIARDYPDGVSVTELSRLLHVKPPSITTPLNHMEKKGLVHRVQDSNDRRVVRIYITEEGETCLEQAKQMFNTRTRKLLEHLGIEKAKQYVLLMEEVLAYVKSEHEQQNTHL